MSDLLKTLGVEIHNTTEKGFGVLDKLIATARPEAVFQPPIITGDYAVITASEVSCGLGVGFGGGGGYDEDPGLKGRHDVAPETGDPGLKTRHDIAPDDEDEGLKTRHDVAPGGQGVGGGGGGFSTGRPVAAISIGPDGVHVEPIVDATKVALAFFTTLGAMAMMWSSMRKGGK